MRKIILTLLVAFSLVSCEEAIKDETYYRNKAYRSAVEQLKRSNCHKTPKKWEQKSIEIEAIGENEDVVEFKVSFIHFCNDKVFNHSGGEYYSQNIYVIK